MSESAGSSASPHGTFPARTLAHLQVVDGVVWALLLSLAGLVLIGTLMETDFGSGPDLLQLLFTTLVVLIPAAFTVGHALAARGLYTGRPSGKRLLSLFAWVGLVRVPFGTVSSILTLAALRADRRAAATGEPATGQSPGKKIAVFWGLWQAEIVLFICFLVVVNTMGAVSASRSKRTMSDMRSIATAIEAYGVDYDVYPKARSITELSSSLSPLYIKQIPPRDGWGRDFRYETSDDQKSYVLVSAGKDGKFEQPGVWGYPEGPTNDDGLDIVYQDGRFIRYVGHVHSPDE